MKRMTLLCVGPSGVPRTGQSIATETWITTSSHRIIHVGNNFEGRANFVRLLKTTTLPFRVFLRTIRSRPAGMYLSLKRSIPGAFADLLCVIAFRSIARGPVLVHLHGADLKEMQSSHLARAIVVLIWKAVTDVIVLSPRMVDQLEGLPDKCVHVIPNFSARMASEDVIQAKTKKLETEPLRVLYLSNIMFTKGFSYLVDAIRMLRAEGVNIGLTLAGRPLDDEIMSANEAIDLLNGVLGDGINYLGVLNGQEKWRQLEGAHVVALPTFYPIEAQPLCLIEGMAFGAVPLTTRHNYNEDFLDPRSALFVAPQDATAIADALRALHSNRCETWTRMKLAAQIAYDLHRVEGYTDAIDRVAYEAVMRRLNLATNSAAPRRHNGIRD
ncbi:MULTISPECIES: glycosyltransferase family 4 protein [unclassified Sulfitobacter]|uniref:glycosyltransferase family 4 protein n=1 Tax=unclassified Sulfitobacter TaxID=196795 RepID=UPI003746CF6D